MSLLDNKGVSLFPTTFIKESIQAYTVKNGKPPRILVISSDDYLDYTVSCTMLKASTLGVEKIQRADYLEPGEIELCQD